LAGAVSLPSADAQRSRRPNVVQLSYGETAEGPDRRLEAFSRHTTAVRFTAVYRGRRANAPGRYHSEITDTDLHGGASHPWVPDRDRGGSRVIGFVHRSLETRGVAKVRVHARNGDRVDLVRVRIDLSSKDCIQDPPLYPVDCEIHV
jgi:hypothetical protein